jgi:hypothetical protein
MPLTNKKGLCNLILMNLVKAVGRSLYSFRYHLALLVLSLVVVSGVSAQDPNIRAVLPFQVPTLGKMLTFVIRFFFVIAGLMALLYLLLGALAWITSGGNKEGVEKAREKIQAAIIGLILIVVVLAIIWTLEQIVFSGHICVGISCDVTIPRLLPQ